MTRYKLNEVHRSTQNDVEGWFVIYGYLVQTREEATADKIRGWGFAMLSAEGYNPRTGAQLWVFRIPKEKWLWVCNTLGLPLPSKSPGRVAHGKTRSHALKKGAESPRQIGKLAI